MYRKAFQPFYSTFKNPIKIQNCYAKFECLIIPCSNVELSSVRGVKLWKICAEQNTLWHAPCLLFCMYLPTMYAVVLLCSVQPALMYSTCMEIQGWYITVWIFLMSDDKIPGWWRSWHHECGVSVNFWWYALLFCSFCQHAYYKPIPIDALWCTISTCIRL